MAAYFVDLDGTIFRHGTNAFLPGAKDLIEKIKDKGNKLIFTTRRGEEFKNHPVYAKDPTLKALKELDIEYDGILFDIDSPRFLINDDGAFAIDHNTNSKWREEDIAKII